MIKILNSALITNPSEHLRCEVAVVGSGPGGAVTACTLAEAGCDVLLIEEGPFLPLESCRAFSLEEMVQKYRNGGLTATMGTPRVQYAEGRCVGGGSEVNSGLYYRTPTEVLEHWKTHFHIESLSESDLLSHFETCERDITVSYLPGQPPLASLKLQEGATKLGWKSREVPRWFKYEDSSDKAAPVQGTRQSMTKTYIPRALKAGCRLLADTKVNSLKQQGRKWYLKSFYLPKSELQRAVQIEADSVFIAGGAIQTPALLRRSGIVENIGNSLQLHPTIKLLTQFPERVNSIEMGVPVHQVKEFSPRISFGCSVSSVAYLALGMNDHPNYLHEVNKNWEFMAIYYAMITGKGKGKVRHLPGFTDPLVRYYLTREDFQAIIDGVYKLSRLLFEAGAIALYPSVRNSPKLTQEMKIDEFYSFLTKELTNLMTIHLFSSCPMGERRDVCAVDSFGKVHGFKGLYVADASLLCTAPGVNPQGSIMAIVRRNAFKFLGKL